MIIQDLGLQNYKSIWHAMRDYTISRHEKSEDQIWLLQHPAVFTQGQAGKKEHILNPGNIPVVQTDRGGQVTYHGPGQLIAYFLFDLERAKMNTQEFVSQLEKAVIDTLSEYSITATSRTDARGVYVNKKKICSIGLRIRRGCSYHGLAFNIDMDLEPFSRINPCGYTDIKMTQLKEFLPNIKFSEAQAKLQSSLIQYLNKKTL